LEDLGVEGRIILKRILNKYNGLREWDLCGSVQRQDAHEHVKEPSDPIDCGSTE
jgi:hypothetical protein